MKRILPYLALFAVSLLAFLAWKKFNLVEPTATKAQLPKAIEKINKKIPEKLSPTPTPNIVKIVKKKEEPKENAFQLPKPKQQNEILPEDEIAVHLQAPNGDLIITSVTVVDDLIIAHGDIIVGRITSMDDFLERARTGKAIVMPLPRLWEGGVIPYKVDENLTNSAEIKAAIETINDSTNVKWIPQTDEKDYVRFQAGSLHCYSPLGKIGGEQSISLSESCTKGSIMHEMLHTLGLLHEQNREDRDDHIRILWENIDPKNHLQFQKIANGLLDFEKHPFDFKSIMLYTQSAFSKYQDDFTIVRVDGDTYYPNKEELSSGDLKKLESLYPKD